VQVARLAQLRGQAQQPDDEGDDRAAGEPAHASAELARVVAVAEEERQNGQQGHAEDRVAERRDGEVVGRVGGVHGAAVLVRDPLGGREHRVVQQGGGLLVLAERGGRRLRRLLTGREPVDVERVGDVRLVRAEGVEQAARLGVQPRVLRDHRQVGVGRGPVRVVPRVRVLSVHRGRDLEAAGRVVADEQQVGGLRVHVVELVVQVAGRRDLGGARLQVAHARRVAQQPERRDQAEYQAQHDQRGGQQRELVRRVGEHAAPPGAPRLKLDIPR
jgi:hypothetical protein